MKALYIKNAFAISPQAITSDRLERLEVLNGDFIHAQPINYKELIPPMSLRRMSTSVKIGLGCSLNVLKDSDCSMPDAIITSTGMGCLEDTEKFLNNILEQHEELLTPTSFIQSTHNTISAQIALHLKCKAYNNTFSHASISFESALIDCQLFVEENSNSNVLVGGVDEIGSELIPLTKELEQDIQIPFSEGGAFFLLTDNTPENLPCIKDVITYNSLSEIPLKKCTEKFLELNGLNPSSIDLLILGSNGDNFDVYYSQMKHLFPKNLMALNYKNYFGEHFSASALATFLGYLILINQKMPGGSLPKPIKNILIYNQFKGKDHGFILMSI